MWECSCCEGLFYPHYTQCPICHTPRVGTEKFYRFVQRTYKETIAEEENLDNQKYCIEAELSMGELDDGNF